jgi:hypothetical protein
MLSTGKSWLKSAVVVPRLKLAVPSVLLEPNGLSAPDSAVEWCVSSSKRRSRVGFHAALKPSDLFCVFVAKSAAPMAMSLLAGLMVSEYTSGLETGPLVHELVDGPKLNQAEMSLRLVWILFSE